MNRLYTRNDTDIQKHRQLTTMPLSVVVGSTNDNRNIAGLKSPSVAPASKRPIAAHWSIMGTAQTVTHRNVHIHPYTPPTRRPVILDHARSSSMPTPFMTKKPPSNMGFPPRFVARNWAQWMAPENKNVPRTYPGRPRKHAKGDPPKATADWRSI